MSEEMRIEQVSVDKIKTLGGEFYNAIIINAMKDETIELARIIRETVPTDRIYLFGSYAYGTPNKDSDYDLYVVLPDGALRPLDAMRKIRYAFHRFGKSKPVDLLVSSKSNFEYRKMHPTIERKIVREGVLLA